MNKTSFFKRASGWLKFAGLAAVLTLIFFVFSIFAIFSKGVKLVKNTLGIKDKATDPENTSFIDEVLAEIDH